MKSLFDLVPLTDNEIKDKEYPSSELWLVKFKDQVIGPFHTDTLSAFADENKAIMEQVLACSFAEDSWSPFYHNTRFQRRTPKLVKEQTLIQSDEFFLAIEGEKQGPFTSDEIIAKLDSGEILSSHDTSLDGGKTWFKIYEHHQFDRRTKKSSQDIPFSPKESEIAQQKQQVVDSYEMPIIRGQDEFIKLAHYARTHKEEIAPKSKPVQQEEKKADIVQFPDKKPASQSGWKGYAAGVCAVFLIAFFTVYNIIKEEKPANYSFDYKASKTNNKRKPASINSHKPRAIQRTLKRPSRRRVFRQEAVRPKRAVRNQLKVSKPRVIKKYHQRKNDLEVDPYQEIVENESNNILDVNRAEDREFLEDLKREIASTKENKEDARDKEANKEGDEYDDEEEEPIVEKDPFDEDEESDPRDDY